MKRDCLRPVYEVGLSPGRRLLETKLARMG